MNLLVLGWNLHCSWHVAGEFYYRRFYQDSSQDCGPAGNSFSDEANKIKRCLDKAHDEYERDLTESELEAVFYTSHPTLTTAQRSSYQKMFNEMRSENAIGPDMASNILRDLWRRAIADDLASHAMDMINGRVTSMMPLREMIEQYEEDFMPSVRVTSMKPIWSSFASRSA